MYLKAIVDFGLIYEKGENNLNITSYSDSDFVDDMEYRKSIMVAYRSLWTT